MPASIIARMTTPLVECIANFSEARRPAVVDAIAQAINSLPTIHVLDRHSDMDHNRTVITFVVSPAEIEEAAFRAIAKAAELINLDEHHGEHPRIGATDVVPFVPIAGVTMDECVEIARRLGERVGANLGIPVYLYEAAATRPERQNLENIRHGEYEALKDEIAVKPERAPDFGPLHVGPAGATVIGARQPLIAFNVYLATDDVAIAKKIARSIRFSSGGLRYVKALGLLVDGRAQVSMNLTNFHGTPLALVVETIRREAARYGASIHHSELVGLIPQEALVEAAQWYLQLDQFKPDQVLEKRLAGVQAQQTGRQAPGAFLEALASAEPTPGGGSAAAYSCAAGAALVAMVARLTIGRKKYADVEEQMRAVLAKAEALDREMQAAVTQDMAAFDALMAAYRLPKENEEQQNLRSQAVEQATLEAARVPLLVARKAVEVMEIALQVTALGNLNAISDGASGASMARAALTGAGYNVRINVPGLQDQQAAQSMLAELSGYELRAAETEEKIRAELRQRAGMALE
jgi:glutamate formiminotransferase/formiminotetrahydrofolate cyclodeaminase